MIGTGRYRPTRHRNLPGALPGVAILLLVAAASLLHAQDSPRVSFGVTGSTFRGLLSGSAPVYSGGVGCGLLFENGTTSGGEVNMHLRLGGFPSPSLFTSIIPSWRSETSTLTHEFTGGYVFDAEFGEARQIDRQEYELMVRGESFGVAFLVGPQVSRGITVGIGPYFGYTYRTRTSQSDRIIAPDDLAFPDGQRRRDMVEGAVYTTRPLQAGFAAGGRAELPIGERLHLAFDLKGSYDFLSPVVGASWQSIRIGGGLGLQFHLDPPPQVPLIPGIEDTVVAGPLPAGRISAAIDLYGLDGRKESEEIDVLFEEADYCTVIRPSAMVVDVVELLEDRSEGDTISVNELVQLEDSLLHARGLDLLGLSLRDIGDEGVEIQYPTSDGSRGLRRAERLQLWLAENYGVIAALVSVGGSGESALAGGNLRVVPWGAPRVPPLRTHRLDREFEAPTVKVRTSQEAEAGVRGWEITISNDSNEIARYSSAQPEGRASSGIDWSMLYSPNDLDSSTLSAVFMVEDSIGGRAIAHSESRMVVRRIRIFVGRIVDVENGTTTLVLGLPAGRSPGLQSYFTEALLQALAEERKDEEPMRAAAGILPALPEEPESILSEAEAARLLEQFGACGNSQEGIDPATVIVIDRTVSKL